MRVERGVKVSGRHGAVGREAVRWNPLPGCIWFWVVSTDGIARSSLNRRLQALKPPASEDATKACHPKALCPLPKCNALETIG